MVQFGASSKQTPRRMDFLLRSDGRGLVAGLGLTLGVAVILAGARSGARPGTTTLEIAVTACAALIAATRSLRRAGGSAPAAGAAWRLIAAGCAVWAGGRVVGTISLRSGDGLRAVVAANVGYAVMVPLMLAGIVLVRPPRRTNTDGLKLLLDLVIAVATLVTIAWVAVLGPVVRGPGVAASVKTTVALHTAGDAVMLLTVLVLALRVGNGVLSPALRALGLSLALFVVADLGWVTGWANVGGGLDDLVSPAWVAAFLGIALAGPWERRVAQSREPVPDTETEGNREALWRLVMPYSLALVLLLLVARQALTKDVGAQGPIIIVGSLTVIALVIVRQGLTLRDSQRLTHRLSQQVDRDPLTGLINHRKVQERLERELAHARACGHPVAVALIDVDNFKAVNDRYGHQAGDQVLRTLATILVHACRSTDVAARYAGDEFILVLPGLDLPDARAVAQRLLNEVGRRRATLAPGPNAQISLSVGLAVTRQCGKPPRQLIAIADAAMYDAKDAGKHRVAIVDADSLKAETALVFDPQLAMAP